MPVLAVLGSRREVDLDARLVEREPRQRHEVLPADEAADLADVRRDRPQALFCPEPPHETLVVRRHQLAVVQCQRAVRREDEQRVVQRAARQLVRADCEPQVVRMRNRAEPPRVGAWHDDRLAGQQRERRLRVAAAGKVTDPAVRRVDGDVRLRKERDPRTGGRHFGGKRFDLRNRRRTVEHHGLGLNARDRDGLVHRCELTRCRGRCGPPYPSRRRRGSRS